MKPSKLYRVEFEIDPASGHWVASVPDFPEGLVEGRTLEQTRARMRAALAEWLGLPERTYRGRTVDEVRLPARVSRAVRDAKQARQRAARAQAEAARRRRAAVARLLRFGLSLRDAGELLGVTRQRAHQLLGRRS
jgi:predicted RNase H-like HicB family nuclease